MIPILCFSLCSTFVFLVPLLVLYFQLSRATSGALPFVFSRATSGALSRALLRFSRATSGALSRALLSVFSCNFWCPFSCSTSVFSCNFWCPFSCSTFGFLVQLLVPFLVLYFRFSRATSGALPRAISCATVTENFQKKKRKKGEKHLCKLPSLFPFVLIARAKPPFGLQPLAQIGDHAWRIAPSSNF